MTQVSRDGQPNRGSKLDRSQSPIEVQCGRGVCVPSYSAAELNSNCFCVTADPEAVRAKLEPLLRSRGVDDSMQETHPHLFASLPVYVPHAQIERIARVVAAIEEVIGLPAYRSEVMLGASAIARVDPGSPGGLLGLDFHLTPDNIGLIEINTNPGGVLLNTVLGQAQSLCMPEIMKVPTDLLQVENAVVQAFQTEWRLQGRSEPLTSIAIVDESPTEQYLYPEFCLFQDLFRRHGLRADICRPEALVHRSSRLWLNGEPVDMIYNRLTDFALEEEGHARLRAAYESDEVVLSPHPRAHALYADKRNLVLLSDPEFLRRAGASPMSVESLFRAVPRTYLVSPQNRDSLWGNRRNLFFKPSAGYGSKAAYRGDKLTRRVWDEISSGKTYVAQELVKPSERQVSAHSDPLKVDIRCYAYQGQILLYAARMYQGQTTNFRTPSGGFAPVLTLAEPGQGVEADAGN